MAHVQEPRQQRAPDAVVRDEADAVWDAAWLAELDHRAEELDRDPSKFEDWAVVKQQLLDDLRQA